MHFALIAIFQIEDVGMSTHCWAEFSEDVSIDRRIALQLYRSMRASRQIAAGE